MIFDLEDIPGVWFDFPGGGKVQLRNPSPADIMSARKECVTREAYWKEGMPAPMTHEIVDQDRFSTILNDLSIVAWEGFFDKQKRPIPCTAENKTALMRMKSPVFRDFVNEKLKALDEAEVEKAKVLEKN